MDENNGQSSHKSDWTGCVRRQDFEGCHAGDIGGSAILNPLYSTQNLPQKKNMKKLLFIAVAFALYNHWGAVAGWLRGEPNVADMRGSFSVTEDGVVLYATSWCG